MDDLSGFMVYDERSDLGFYGVVICEGMVICEKLWCNGVDGVDSNEKLYEMVVPGGNDSGSGLGMICSH